MNDEAAIALDHVMFEMSKPADLMDPVRT